MADMIKNPIDLSEVQDFSISSKGKSGGGQQNVFGMQLGGSGGGKGSKLDSMLSKLMKKNNVVSKNFMFLDYLPKETSILIQIQISHQSHLCVMCQIN